MRISVNCSAMHRFTTFGRGGQPYGQRIATALLFFAAWLTAPSAAAQFGGPAVTVPPLFIPYALPVDLDQDGDDDVVAPGPGGAGYVYTLLNGGFASFIFGPFIPAPIGTSPLAVGDLNGDGRKDIVGLTSTSIVIIFVQTTSAPYVTLPLPAIATGSLELRDFDGDGDLDIIFGLSCVLRNNGAGTFGAAEPIVIEGGATGQLCDYDGDGDLDLVRIVRIPATASSAPATVLEHYRQEAGIFRLAEATGIPVAPVLRTFSGDFDGDGDPDLAAFEYQFGIQNSTWPPIAYLHFFRNIGGSLVYVSTAVPPTMSGISELYFDNAAVADLDGDGDDDLAFNLHDNGGIGLPQYYLTAALSTGNGFAPLALGAGSTVNYQSGIFGRFAGGAGSGPDLLTMTFAPSGSASYWSIIVKPNTLAQTSFPNRLSVVSGDDQSDRIGRALAQPLVVRLTNAAGQPIPGQLVAFSSLEPGVSLSPPPITTDANGFATANMTLGNAAGPVNVKVQAAGARPVSFHATATGMRGFTVPASATTTLVGVDFVYDRPDLAITIALDALPPVPFVQSSLGDIWTSIVSPLPTLLLLDGLGVLGTPVPGVVTSPNYVATATIPVGTLAGVSLVAQGYAIDWSRPYPDLVVITNPVTLNF